MTLMKLDAPAIANARPLLFSPEMEAPRALIRDERAGDLSAREKLLDAAFGPARFRKTCERLREGRAPADGLALAAVDGARVAGTIRLWHVNAGGVAALLLGPLAVAKSHRSHGLGARLMGEALFRAACQGHRAVLLVGDARYYARFGFSRAAARGLELPGPVEAERFLALELEPGALDGARGIVRASGTLLAPEEMKLAA